jgi:hypothetical protein
LVAGESHRLAVDECGLVPGGSLAAAPERYSNVTSAPSTYAVSTQGCTFEKLPRTRRVELASDRSVMGAQKRNRDESRVVYPTPK